MSLISIAQRETFHISFVQFGNKGYDADLLLQACFFIEQQLPAIQKRLGNPCKWGFPSLFLLFLSSCVDLIIC
mgnify:CR=1 FL=1